MKDHLKLVFSSRVGYEQTESVAEFQALKRGGGDGTSDGMDERLRSVEVAVGKVETTIEGLRHSQNIMIGGIGILAAAIIAYGIYSLQRFDAIDQHVAALPGQISADLRDLTGTLATAITAARSGQPQVIIMPAPQPQPAPPKE